VEASNSCAGTLIFGSFFFIVFCQSFFFFFSPLFAFFLLSVFIVFSPFVELVFVFIVLHFSSSFSTLFYSCFFGSCDSYLAYPNLLGTKRLGCCCC
jgi:hypothetical protein